MNRQVIEINDVDYFCMIDNQIRTVLPKHEVAYCLPLAERILQKFNISFASLLDYPYEGYYYKSDDLKRYFKIIRNLNHNEKLFDIIQPCKEVDELKAWCENNLFGKDIENSRVQDSYNPTPLFNDGVIQRRYDPMTLVMMDKRVAWNVDSIRQYLPKYFTDTPNLVELAYLTGDNRCLTCGAETNALYRMYAVTSSSSLAISRQPEYHWNVSQKVEEFGTRLVDAYNVHIQDDVLVSPTLESYLRPGRMHLSTQMETPRVAFLGIAEPNQHYYWIVDSFGKFYDHWDTRFITTEDLTKNSQFITASDLGTEGSPYIDMAQKKLGWGVVA